MLVDKLILGTAQLGLDYGINNSAGKPDEAAALAILDAAWDLGLRMLDTASAYGDAIALVGQWHSRNPGRQFNVISKVSGAHGSTGTVAEIEAMNRALGVDVLWALLQHRPQELIANPALLESMVWLRDSDLTARVGVSVYGNDELDAFAAMPQVDLIQLPFNLLDNAGRRGRAISMACAAGKQVHARSVFLQGLFCKEPARFPDQLQPLRPYVEHLTLMAADAELDIGTMALAYVLSQKDISGVLIGVDSVRQLHQNVAGVERLLPPDIVAAIDDIRVAEAALLSPVNWTHS